MGRVVGKYVNLVSSIHTLTDLLLQVQASCKLSLKAGELGSPYRMLSASAGTIGCLNGGRAWFARGGRRINWPMLSLLRSLPVLRADLKFRCPTSKLLNCAITSRLLAMNWQHFAPQFQLHCSNQRSQYQLHSNSYLHSTQSSQYKFLYYWIPLAINFSLKNTTPH